MKRVLQWVGIVVAVLVLLAGAAWVSIFGSNLSATDGPVSDGVELVKDGFVNVFVLDAGGGKVALVDAGHDASGKAVLAALARRGVTPASVAAVFLTHGHPDHTAGCKLFPAADVYAMEAEIPVVGDACKVSHPLKDGEIAQVGDLRVEAFATPGHTPGSMVYLSRGVLFFGDSAGASKSGDIMPAVRIFTKEPAQNAASLKSFDARLQARKDEIKAMAFGHTGSLSGMGPLDAFVAAH